MPFKVAPPAEHSAEYPPVQRQIQVDRPKWTTFMRVVFLRRSTFSGGVSCVNPRTQTPNSEPYGGVSPDPTFSERARARARAGERETDRQTERKREKE